MVNSGIASGSFYYKTNDWDSLEAKDPDFIEVRQFRVPYGVFENMPEETLDPRLIGAELECVTCKLWSTLEKKLKQQTGSH